MSQTDLQKKLDPGFQNLKGMIAELGDDFVPARMDLETLIDDTRQAMASPRPSMRGG